MAVHPSCLTKGLDFVHSSTPPKGGRSGLDWSQPIVHRWTQKKLCTYNNLIRPAHFLSTHLSTGSINRPFYTFFLAQNMEVEKRTIFWPKLAFEDKKWGEKR
jgi:hypothetical protein